MAIVATSRPTPNTIGHGINAEIAGGFQNIANETSKVLSTALDTGISTGKYLGTKALNITKGSAHSLASTLTLPLHGSLALAKGIKQSIHATATHGIVDSIKKAGNKQGRERYLSGFTLGGYNLGKAALNMIKRVPEAAVSGFSPAYSNISDTVKRKRDYTTRKKKGVFARIGESISQIGSGRSYQQPKDRVPTIIPTDFPKKSS